MVKALRNESTRIKQQFTPDLSICCLLNGMWQVSGAHGRIDPKKRYQSIHGCRLHDLGSGRPLWPSLYWEFRRQQDALSTYKLSQSGYQGRLESQRSWSSRTLIPSKDGWEHLTWSSSIGGNTVIKTTWTHSGICRNSSPRENQAPWLNLLENHPWDRYQNSIQPSAVFSDWSPSPCANDSVLSRQGHQAPTAHSAAACCLRSIWDRTTSERWTR